MEGGIRYLIGERFGKLIVLSYNGKNNSNQHTWNCKCDCGNPTIVSTANLTNGSTQSCGCLRFKQSPKENLIGNTFNRLTVIRLNNEKSPDGRFLWECKCDCGSNEVVIATAKDLKCNRKRSCSCLRNKKQKLTVDLTGKEFGLLTVIKLRRDLQKEDKQFVWECKCICGEISYVLTRNLQSGQTKSCGCLKENPESPYKIDEVFKNLLSVWTGVKKRCANPNYEGFKYYGGRGISVCKEWSSFIPFYEWAVENGYEKGLQIDRKYFDGNYEPSNCRWVTPKENSQNRRSTRLITIKKDTKSLSEWAEQIGITKKALSDRIERDWKDADLLLPGRERSNIRKFTGEPLTINGGTKAFSEWAEAIGISYATLRDRVTAGWSDDELLMPKGYRRKSNK